MIKGLFPTEEFTSQRTPFYYYDVRLLRTTLEEMCRLVAAYPSWQVHYALKANFNAEILRIIAGYGLGAECVSGGEIRAALAAGFAPASIIFSGVGKRDDEIILALQEGIGRFNVESTAELQVINDIALSLGKKAAINIRVNPDIGSHISANISASLAETKFGIHHSMLESAVLLASELPGIKLCGLHFHIGSQILDMNVFTSLSNRVNQCLALMEQMGVELVDVNMGGGLGVEYEHPNHVHRADFASYFKVFGKHLNTILPVHFELGRSIVAPCGALISRVLYIKEGLYRRFVVLDASMTDLIRPALYHAYHRIENISSDEPEEQYDVVGPVCESSDVFDKGAVLNRCHRGDFVAIRSAGAYGESMASHFSCRPLPGYYLSNTQQ